MKKADMVHAEMVLVTPETAKEWLSKNLDSDNGSQHSNRKFKQRSSDRYLRRMERGEWNECNGETIKFDRNGNLIDGQHRLDAQIRFGKPLWWLVAFNCSDRAFVTIDNGSPRGGPDVLSINDESNVNVLSATVGLVLKYKDGAMNRMEAPSNSEIEQTVSGEEGERIRKSVTEAIGCRAPKGFLAPSVTAFVHYMGGQKHGDEKARAFIRGVCQGERTTNDQPITALRQRLVENLTSPKRVHRIVVLAWCVKAWNAYIEGAKISKGGLRFKHRATRDDDGKTVRNAEDFPAIR